MSIILFILGTIIGSFLGVVIYRSPRKESFISGRSHCEYCKTILAWYDLIPLLSFLSTQGKCRYCKKFIGWLPLLLELITGISFVAVGYYVSSMQYVLPSMYYISLLYYLIIISGLIIIFFIDIIEGIIPDVVLFPVIILTFFYTLLTTNMILLSIISGVICFLFFLMLFLGTKGRGMGFGDVKFVFFMGLFLGFPKIIFGMYGAFLTGAVLSLILVIWGKKKFFGGTIPFGPFLIFGTLFGLVYGDFLWRTISHYLF